MGIYIKNGTAPDGPSLCETCSRAFVARGYRESEIIVVCQAMEPERRISFRVRECSRYTDKTRQTIYEMEKIALVLDPKEIRREAGFLPLDEVSKRDENVELILDGNLK
jgi:hypothetical protein